MGHGDDFGDYIVFVDESGDQSLEKIDSGYPVFVLSFCIFEKKHYYSRVVPETLRLKFDFFGSDIPILHEREIRKRENDFRILMDTTVRESFFARLNAIMTNAEYTIVSTLIDKRTYSHYAAPSNPYYVGAQFGLERVFYYLQEHGQRGKRIPLVFESRGKNEDENLRKAFDTIMQRTQLVGMPGMFDFHCVSKKANLQGLQLADLVARPIGTHYLHPSQPNRAWDMLSRKMRSNPQNGGIEGYGLKIYPAHEPTPLGFWPEWPE